MLLFLLFGPCSVLGSAWANDPIAYDFLLSLVRPAALQPQEETELGSIDRLLSVPLGRPHEQDPYLPRVFADWPTARYDRSRVTRNRRALEELSGTDRLLIGKYLGLVHERFSMLASIHPMVQVVGRRSGQLLDSSERLESVGSLVSDSTRIYSRLEIEVEISKFALKLYGYRQDEKTLIYSARVGLGSHDYPTPRGSYYVMRIYDDHPLWIPPPDREWAWGQSPSRSVYGGHMMPLFLKRPEGRRYESTDRGSDSIAPRMQIVDSGGYRVHGTDSPWSVGFGQSHGCVRMLNSTVAQLANCLKLYVGTTERGKSANGAYVDLARPVKLVLR